MAIRPDVYRSGESATAELNWSSSMVVTGEDGYTIHSWVCFSNGQPGHLYHVYVPPQLRSEGIAKALVEHFVGKVYTVHKPWPNGIPKGHTVTYNPWV
jgi:GNAT superfamily N-acetyltransferase